MVPDFNAKLVVVIDWDVYSRCVVVEIIHGFEVHHDRPAFEDFVHHDCFVFWKIAFIFFLKWIQYIFSKIFSLKLRLEGLTK